MDLDQFLRDARSRRAFFRAAGVSVAGGSAMFLAACGNGTKKVSGDSQSEDQGGNSEENPSSDVSDVNVLNSALDLEHMAIAAYTAGAKLLRGSALRAGRLFLSHEQEHAQALTRTIRDLKGSPSKARASYDFPTLRSQADVLRFAQTIENTAIAAYIDALPKLDDPKLRATGAAIVTNEAEHVAVLRTALGQDPAPSAFVIGAAA
jgi:rubrerythrin